jgi:glutamate/tyrosine decarboxylase-like PLP-dependent enzyme
MDPLDVAHREAKRFLEAVDDRPAGAPGIARPLDELPETGTDPATVVEQIAQELDPGIVATAGSRYFGFVTGGALPAAMGADWLASVWDQNAALAVMSPAMAAVETITARWLLDLLRLPADAGVGFVTGGQMANFTCLLAARHTVLQRAGHDVEADGLQGAPEIRVVVGEHVHVAALSALRYAGFGANRAERVPADDQGRMLAEHLELDDRPTIVLAQMGDVNTGAFDPLDEITAKARAAANTWVHVDGAFGLWAAASPAWDEIVAGHDRADSWGVDGHKWLNVPYDSGFAIVADAAVHRAALGASAAYLQAAADERQGFQWVPEASRRARALPAYAALRQLGRRGVAELVERCCFLARRFAQELGEQPGVEVLNDVVLNQVLVRFGDDDERTRAVIQGVQEDGTCWLGGTTFRGRAAMRISVSSWQTSEEDVDRSAQAILAVASRS